MGRCYKLIMAFFISIFMIISATFVYKVEAFNLMNIGYLFKKIESVEYKKIKVEYYTKEFKKRIKTYSDFTAQIIQHEIDHLEGILI